MFNVAGVNGNGLRSVVNTRTIVDPDIALKLSGKAGAKNRFAAIYASDDRGRTEGGDLENADVMVGRFVRALKGDSFLGGIYTRRASGEDINDVAGVDGTIRLTQASSVSAHIINSFVQNAATTEAIHDHAEGINYAINKRKLFLSASIYNLSKDFSTDVGFVGRTGMTSYNFFVNPRIYPNSESSYTFR